MTDKELKQKVRLLRSLGNTYREILDLLEVAIPKSTLSCWCRDVEMPQDYAKRVKGMNLENLKKARQKAIVAKRRRSEKILEGIERENVYLTRHLKSRDIQKLLLSMLYLGEGAKYHNVGSLRLGSSDSDIIQMYLKLLQNCYQADPSKFRARIQCRADQDIESLEKFWHNKTNIPKHLFYKTWKDKRTEGKPTRKSHYKGVCVIDYFDSRIQKELEVIAKKIIKKGL